MSSHREAPETSKDPVADSTDVYAFVSPDHPDTVTLIANYIPFEEPAGGPNFYEFGDDVLYEINIDNSGDGQAGINYQFLFQTQPRDPRSGWHSQPAGQRAGVPAVQHRPAVHPGLRLPGARGRAQAARRDQGVRRPAGRGLLRRPRRYLRPG